MTSPVETLGPLERKLSLNLSVEKINAEIEQRLRKVARTARLPGFRPGKVPMKIVAQNYGAQVHSEVVGEELEKEFNSAVQHEHLRVAGSPRIEAANDASEAVLSFDATFEILPDIKFGDFSNIEIEQFQTDIGDIEIDRTIEILRKQRASYKVVEREAQLEDRIKIDFVGKIDGIAFERGSAEDFVFYAGKKQMLPEFEEAVLGLKVTDVKSFDLKFPDDYHSKEVAGKIAQFDITVKLVEGPVLPEVNDDFAKSLGVTDGDVAKLREEVKTNLAREVGSRMKTRTKESVMNGLLKAAEFDVPKALVQSEIRELVARARAEFKEQGMVQAEQMELPDSLFTEQAERRIRLGLMVSEVVKQNGLHAKPEQVRAHIEEVAQSYENPIEVMKWYLSERSKLADVEALVLENNVVDWILSKAKVSVKALSFDEIMGNV